MTVLAERTVVAGGFGPPSDWTHDDWEHCVMLVRGLCVSDAEAEDVVSRGIVSCLERGIELNRAIVFTWARFHARDVRQTAAREKRWWADWERCLSGDDAPGERLLVDLSRCKRHTKPPIPAKPCPVCGKMFRPVMLTSARRKKTCSASCGATHAIKSCPEVRTVCGMCGAVKVVRRRGGKPGKWCSNRCKQRAAKEAKNAV